MRSGAIVRGLRAQELAEDEVDGADDLGFGVELIALVREQSVLVAIQPDAIVALTAVLGGEGQGLSFRRCVAEGVKEVQFVDLQVLGPSADGCCEVVAADVSLREVVGDVDRISGIRGGVFGVGIDDQVRCARSDVLTWKSAVE